MAAPTMTVWALQHLYSSVERGYFPRHGTGFQTVAVAEELAGTEDLALLEEASFYAVSRERRSRGDLPVKECFFRLPSGRFALGRTLPWGADALGREGNYLTHHLIVTRDDLRVVAGAPFALLDAIPKATPDTDRQTAERVLTARALPPLALSVAPVAPAEPEFSGLEGLAPSLRAGLGAALIERGDRSLLIIGEEQQSRRVLRGLFALLPPEERLRLTFSTHFYECEHLRPHFAVVTVGSRGEAPAGLTDYRMIDLDGEPLLSPTSAYGKWLASCLHSGEWAPIRTMNRTLDRLRRGERRPGELPLLPGAPAGAALWEQVGPALAPALVGQAERIPEYLASLPERRRLADALLALASPSQLCGAAAPSRAAREEPIGQQDRAASHPGSPPRPAPASASSPADCLRAVRAAASRRAWRAWMKQWATDPALASFLRDRRPWWRRW